MIKTQLVAPLIAVGQLVWPTLDRNYSPAECPVVGTVASGIYHVPGDRHYLQMLSGAKENPMRQRCFANQDDAQAAGYRKSRARR